MYAGGGFIYEADPDECPNGEDGVALRPLSRYYEEGSDVMYSQLDNASWRWSEAGALEDAEEEYGTNCETPFTRNVFDMDSTDRFFCSKLVWRIYLDNEHHSVNVDSNHYSYFFWLMLRHGLGWPTAWYIITHTVAPDEIARHSDLDNYYKAHID